MFDAAGKGAPGIYRTVRMRRLPGPGVSLAGPMRLCLPTAVGVLVVARTWLIEQAPAGTFVAGLCVLSVFVILLGVCAKRYAAFPASLLLIAFVLRLLLASTYHSWFWQVHGNDLINGSSAYDALRYEFGARQVAQYGWDHSVIPVDQWGTVAYFAALYEIFAADPLVIVFFNALLGGLISLLLFTLLYDWNQRAAQFGAILSLTMPDLTLYSGLLMKELLVGFVLLAAVAAWYRLYDRANYTMLVVLSGCVYILIETRTAFLLIVAGIAGLDVLSSSLKPSRLAAIGGLLIAIVISAYLSVSPFVVGSNILSPEFWLTRREALVSSSTVDVPSPVDAIRLESSDPSRSLGLRTAVDPKAPATYVFIPFRFLTFYLNPPFWVWNTDEDFAPYLQLTSLLIWLLLPAIAWATIYGMRIRRSPARLLAFTFVTSTLLVSVGAPFADPRLRVALLPVLSGVAGIGLSRPGRWIRLMPWYAGAVLAAFAAYTLLKAE